MLPEWFELRKKVETSKSGLHGADLSYAKLMHADLSDANLKQADLSDAYLMRANLAGADLREADLSRAIISEADLKGADLEGAELCDAYLNGADLSGVRNLTCDQLELANFDRETKFPENIIITWDADGGWECGD
ncbi:MAG: pentapeptide repeat-containing protein [Nitrospinaceae bacterium]